MNNTYLFTATYEKIAYKRKQNEVYIKTNTLLDNNKGARKIACIKKHMGIAHNDSWNVVPYNLLVEGEQDKRYLNVLATAFGYENVNILVANGASKMGGYLEFVKEFCDDSSIKPIVKCILDHDAEGKSSKDSLEKKATKETDINIEVQHIARVDGKDKNSYEYEIEDFIYPELLIEEVNIYLKRKGYKVLKKSFEANRFSKSYENMNILKIITENVKTLNPDKDPLDFETDGMKKILCENVCRNIEQNSKIIEEQDMKYPRVKEYIKNIFNAG